MFRLFFSLVLAPIFFVQIVLVILRLHENIRWRWSVVWIPLWGGFFLWFVFLLYNVWGHRAQKRTGVRTRARWRTADTIHHLMWVASLLAVFVLSAVRLDDAATTTLRWSVVVVPLYVLFAFLILWEAYNHWKGNIPWLANNTQHGSPLVRVLTWIGLVVQFAWLGAQLDAQARTQWALVFLPLWIVFALWLLVLLSISRRKLEGRLSEKPKATVSDTAVYYLMWTALVTFFILLSVELESASSVIGALVLFSPLLLLFIIFFVGGYFFYWRYHRTKKNDDYAWKTENYIRQTTSTAVVQNHLLAPVPERAPAAAAPASLERPDRGPPVHG